MSKVIDLTKELIKIDSRNPFEIEYDEKSDKWTLGGSETEVMKYLETELMKRGFTYSKQYVHTDKHDNDYYNLIAEKGEGEHAILLYGHMDTVTARPWLSDEDALTPKIVKRDVNGEMKDCLIGLGANDMKGGVAAILTALDDIEPDGYKIKVVFGVDEEFYSLGGNTLANSEFVDDVKAIMVPEIGDGPNTFYGASTIGIGRLGRCEFEIDVFGTGGHGAVSNTPNFINAATEVAKIITEIENLRKNYNDRYEFYQGKVPDKKAVNYTEGSFFVSRIESGDGSLSIPAKGKIIIDCTFTPNYNVEKLHKMFKDMIDKMYDNEVLRKVIISDNFKKVTVTPRKRPTPFSHSYCTGHDHPFTVYVKDIIDNLYGFMNFNMGYSVADENVFKRVRPEIPVIVVGPIGENSHKANEWAEIESLERLVEIYKTCAKNFGIYLNNL